MARLDIAGIGIWSPYFGDWSRFRHGIESGEWSADDDLQPELIPPKERRRAPQLVKMAIEVMSQACSMAGMNPKNVSTVFSSSMGDMQITDYLCRALAQLPKLISPTRFHNSVHNAAPGYWSIATGSFSAGNAVSAFEHTPSMALLEGCIQVAVEKSPVLVVTQELAAPESLMFACRSEQPFSAALLLAPCGISRSALGSLDFSVTNVASQWPPMPESLQQELGSNMSTRLLPVLTALASADLENRSSAIRLPISAKASLDLTLMCSSRNA